MERAHSTTGNGEPGSRRSRGTSRGAGRLMGRRRAVAVAAVAVLGAFLVPTAGRAASTPPAASVPHAPRSVPYLVPNLPADQDLDLAELEAKSVTLSRQYRGGLVKLEDAQRAAKQATAKFRKAEKRLEKSRSRVARLAVSQYMSSGLDPSLTPMLTGDPEVVLDRAVTAHHLAKSAREKISELETVKRQREEAYRTARKRLDEVRAEIERLEKNRDRVNNLIAKFVPQAPVSTGGTTPRMAHVADVIVDTFGAHYPVGCYRPGSWGEHPLGRACDFMLSSGGAMPSEYQVQRGWEIANYAKANASELGIMYIIYRQQIWDLRTGGGWRMMSDRGSVTANHYDHVHISVF